MIQMRWLTTPFTQPLTPDSRILQFRYRLGGIGVALLRDSRDSGLRMAQNEGWSPWEDVPVVVDPRALEQAPKALPGPEPATPPEATGEFDPPNTAYDAQ